jgi:hypothetical protein
MSQADIVVDALERPVSFLLFFSERHKGFVWCRTLSQRTLCCLRKILALSSLECRIYSYKFFVESCVLRSSENTRKQDSRLQDDEIHQTEHAEQTAEREAQSSRGGWARCYDNSQQPTYSTSPNSYPKQSCAVDGCSKFKGMFSQIQFSYIYM